MRALIHVQHLLGSGHAVRAVAIARALADQGADVVLMTGNTLPATLDTHGLTIAELPPIRAADASFRHLVTPGGAAVDHAVWSARLDRLVDLVWEHRPDVFLTETFPFGRRPFARELLPAIDRVRDRNPRAIVAASLRDILVRKSDVEKERRMAELARRHYDLVLVHADPDLVRLDDSFLFAAEISDLIRYTGYVYTPSDRSPPEGDGDGEVIVACGGGAVGARLLDAAVRARALSARAQGRWRVLASAGHGANKLTELQAAACPGTVVEPNRNDYPGLLKRAAASVSQAGYNTVLDVLAAGCPAVLVPFADGNETEQTQRADILAARGVAEVLPETDVTPESLAAAVDSALARPTRATTIGIDGARRSADILAEAVRHKKGRPT